MRRLGFLLALISACAPDTGRDLVEVALVAEGSGANGFTVDGFVVTLDRAEVAVGPLYLCTTEVPDIDTCEAALFERLDPFVVDALDPGAVPLGPMDGTSGAVRTAFFDYGISWFPTSAEPGEGLPELAGHSAVFEGTATRGADVVRFAAAIDVVPIDRGLVSVKAAPAAFDVTGGEILTVRVDAAALLAGVDFDALLAEVVDPESPVLVTDGSQAYQAIAFQLTAGAPPVFEWLAP